MVTVVTVRFRRASFCLISGILEQLEHRTPVRVGNDGNRASVKPQPGGCRFENLGCGREHVALRNVVDEVGARVLKDFGDPLCLPLVWRIALEQLRGVDQVQFAAIQEPESIGVTPVDSVRYAVPAANRFR